MQPSQGYPVPCWARTFICIAACLSVPGLITVTWLGVEVSPMLLVVAGIVSLRGLGYAFHSPDASGGPMSLQLITEAFKAYFDSRR